MRGGQIDPLPMEKLPSKSPALLGLKLQPTFGMKFKKSNNRAII